MVLVTLQTSLDEFVELFFELSKLLGGDLAILLEVHQEVEHHVLLLFLDVVVLLFFHSILFIFITYRKLILI